MRAYYEKGPIGPETERALRAIENEAREKLGLDPLPDPHAQYDRLMVRYCSHPDSHAPKDCPDVRPEIVQTDALMDLRKKWRNRHDR